MNFPRFEYVWQSFGVFQFFLYPFSFLYQFFIWLRRQLFKFKILKTYKFDVPIVVIGNITVGGSGKTPLVVWLAKYCIQKGWRVGIVSRGYKGKASKWPQQVRPDSDPISVGDEAILLAANTNCPVCVSPKRVDAINSLLDHNECDIIISDDGLQHYSMGRDLEIVVIDGKRRFGNCLFLPAGPLREPLKRVNEADLVIVNGQSKFKEFSIEKEEPEAISIIDGARKNLSDFEGRKIIAIAGIGNPRVFFDLLLDYGLVLEEKPFPDHYNYKREDLLFNSDIPILMTEKDAVKCKRFLSGKNAWIVNNEIKPDDIFIHRLNVALEELINIY